MFYTDRVLIWRPTLEEYGPDIEHVQGDKDYIIRKTIRISNEQESIDYTRVHP